MSYFRKWSQKCHILMTLLAALFTSSVQYDSKFSVNGLETVNREHLGTRLIFLVVKRKWLNSRRNILLVSRGHIVWNQQEDNSTDHICHLEYICRTEQNFYLLNFSMTMHYRYELNIDWGGDPKTLTLDPWTIYGPGPRTTVRTPPPYGPPLRTPHKKRQ